MKIKSGAFLGSLKNQYQKMIYSIALNPSIDRLIEIPNFQVGQTFKARSSVVFYAGKGINVAIAIKELGQETEIIAYIGHNQIYSYSNALNEFKKTFIPVRGDTRNNITIIDPVNQTETHLREPGFEINTKNIQQMQEIVRNKVQKNDWIVFAGSLPPGAPPDFYATLIGQCKEKNVWTVLDSSDDALIWGVSSVPQILKINVNELGQFTGKSISSIPDIIYEANNFIKRGCRFIVVTLGKEGAIGISSTGTWQSELSENFEGGINTVGCGDAFLSGLIVKFIESHSFERALAYATACGAVNTLVQGAGRIELKLVEKMESLIHVKKL